MYVSHLKNHYNHVHTRETEETCPECDKKVVNLQSHMKSSHIKVACAECGVMVGKYQMSKHIKEKHTPNYERKRNQICDICGKAFAQKAGLSPGMVIIRVGQIEVNSIDVIDNAIKNAVKQKRKALLLLVKVKSGTRFVALELK